MHPFKLSPEELALLSDMVQHPHKHVSAVGLNQAWALHPEWHHPWDPDDVKGAEARFRLLLEGLVLQRADNPTVPDGLTVKALEQAGVPLLDIVQELGRYVSVMLAWAVRRNVQETVSSKPPDPKETQALRQDVETCIRTLKDRWVDRDVLWTEFAGRYPEIVDLDPLALSCLRFEQHRRSTGH